jgi:hypothetical protein
LFFCFVAKKGGELKEEVRISKICGVSFLSFLPCPCPLWEKFVSSYELVCVVLGLDGRQGEKEDVANVASLAERAVRLQLLLSASDCVASLHLSRAVEEEKSVG